MTLEKKIETLVKPILKKAGYDLLKIELRFQKRNQMLTITINKLPHLRIRCGGKEGGLSVEDCARVSRLIDPILEKADLIKGRYYLTVSSPGIWPKK